MPASRWSSALPALVLITMFGTSGCRTSQQAQSGKGPSDSTEKSSLLNDGDNAMRAKLKPTIRCLNGPITWYENEAAAYHDMVQSRSAGGQPHWSGSGTYFDINDLEATDGTSSCANELEMGASLPPATPDLDTAARTAATALRTMATSGRELDIYLKQSDYLQDHFSRGKQLDSAISPAYATLLRASDQIRTAVARENGAIRRHELAAIDKREGHSIRWHSQNCMLAARTFNETVQRLRHSGSLDSTSVAAALQPFHAAVTDAQAFVTAHPDLAKEVPNGNRPLWFSIDSGLSDELSAGQQLLDMINHPEKTTSMFPQTPEQLRSAMLDKAKTVNTDFNFLIERYNDAIRYTS